MKLIFILSLAAAAGLALLSAVCAGLAFIGAQPFVGAALGFCAVVMTATSIGLASFLREETLKRRLIAQLKGGRR